MPWTHVLIHRGVETSYPSWTAAYDAALLTFGAVRIEARSINYPLHTVRFFNFWDGAPTWGWAS